MEKDLVILNLLIGWQIIHLSKTGKKLSIRLREFPEGESRFLRITFSKCFLTEFLNFSSEKGKDIKSYDFTGCILSRVTKGYDEMISIHLVKNLALAGSLKIVPSEVAYKFTSK